MATKEPVTIIKYEGDALVYRHPEEDFPEGAVLFVHEGQVAVFMQNGVALEPLGAGRYPLEDAAGSRGLFQKKDNTPFHTQVYFVNTVEQMAIKWGTDSRVEYMEPTYQFPLSIGACGEMSLCVADAGLLLSRLVGTAADLQQKTLVSYFRAFLMTRVKSYIAQVMKRNAISVFEIDENLSLFSEEIKALLVNDFWDYGLSLERFFVTTVSKPEGEAEYEFFRKMHFRKYAEVAEARLRQETTLIDAETAAKKSLIGARAEAEIRATAQESAPITFSDKCHACGTALPQGARFCLACGAGVSVECPACGRQVARGKFCPACGFCFDSAPAVPADNGDGNGENRQDF